MTQDDVKLFEKIANSEELRTKWLRDAATVMPEHPAVREQKILDNAAAPLLKRLEEMEARVAAREKIDRYETERASMRARGLNERRIAELETRMEKAAKEEGMVFDSYAHAADILRKVDMPLGPSTVGIGADFGIRATGVSGAEKWREDMASRDPTKNPALMSRRDRKAYVRALAKEASTEFKQDLGVS
jgi:hypothetical protein